MDASERTSNFTRMTNQLVPESSVFSDLYVNPEHKPLLLISNYLNKKIQNVDEFLKEIEVLLANKNGLSTEILNELEIIYLRLTSVNEVVDRIQVLEASCNQFSKNNLQGAGESACSLIAGEALISLLSTGFHDTQSVDAPLFNGVADYNALLQKNNIRPNSHLAWLGEAYHSFEDRLLMLGDEFANPLDQIKPQVSYQKLLSDLCERAKSNNVTSIGAIVLVSSAFFSLAVHLDDKRKPHVFIYDSHGSNILSREGNAFAAHTSSLEDAALLLALLYPPIHEPMQEARFYPMILKKPVALNINNLISSFSHSKANKTPSALPQSIFFSAQSMPNSVTNTGKSPSKIVSQFAQELNKQKLSLQKEKGVSSRKAEDLNALVILSLKNSVFPLLVLGDPSEQEQMLKILEGWLKEFFPALLGGDRPSTQAPNSGNTDPMQIALATRGIHAFAEFIKGYTAALKKCEQGWLGQKFWPAKASDIDNRIKEALAPQGLHEDEILKKLVLTLVPACDPSAQESLAAFMRDLIDKMVSSEVIPRLIANLGQDEDLLGGLEKQEIEKKTESSTLDVPAEMRQEILNATEALIDLGNPGWLPWMTKVILLKLPQQLPAQVTNSLGQLLSFCAALIPQSKGPKKVIEPDIAGFAIHLLRKHLFAEQNASLSNLKEIKDKERSVLSAKLYDRVHGIALSSLPKPAHLAIGATSYVPFLKAYPALIKTSTTRLINLIQSPEVMKVFIYQYLIKDALIPTLQEVKAQQLIADAEMADVPAPPPIFDTIGKEAADLLAVTLKDYVAPSLLIPELNQGPLLPALSGLIRTFFPSIAAEALQQKPDVEGQKNTCILFEQIGCFLKDFSIARKKANQNDIPIDSYDRVSHILATMNSERLKRGDVPLTIDKQLYLEMCAHVVKKNLLDQKKLNPEAIEKITNILPQVLDQFISTLSPQVLNQLLITILSGNKNIVLEPMSGLESGWDIDTMKRWNAAIVNLLEGALRISSLEEVSVSAVGVPVAKEVVQRFGKELATILPSSSILLDPSGILNMIRMLRSTLWDASSGKPRLDRISGLTQEQKEILKEKVRLIIRESTSLPGYVQTPLNLIGTNELAQKAITETTDAIYEFLQQQELVEAFIFQYILNGLLPRFIQGYSPEKNETFEPLLKISPEMALTLVGLQEDVTIKKCQSTEELYQAVLHKAEEAFVLLLPNDELRTHFKRELENYVKKGIGGEKAYLFSVQKTLERVAKKPKMEFFQEMLNSMRAAENPFLYTTKVVFAMQNFQPLYNEIETVVKRSDTQMLQSYLAEFGQRVACHFGFLTPLQQNIIFSRLQEPIMKNLEAPKDITAPVNVHVCADSKEGNVKKIELIRQAKRSVVLSGCYLGKTMFSNLLEEIEDKIKGNSKFKAYILGSEFMLTEENKKLIHRLNESYPMNVEIIISPEVNPYKKAQTGEFFFSTNHVKALVIDEGEAFMIGGSGIEDRWATQTGLKAPRVEQGGRLLEPLSFRDIDYVVQGKASVGRAIYVEMLKLFAHCSHFKEEELADRYFDPRYIPTLSSTTTSEAILDPILSVDTRIEFHATGPNDKENSFHKRLVSLINHAEKRIVINHMYFLPTEELLSALINASNRGVSIILVTNGIDETSPGSHDLFVPRSRLQWKRLCDGREKENVAIFEYKVPDTTYHKKVVIVDDVLATGSSNIGHKSLNSLDFEYNIIVHSKEAAETTILAMNEDIHLSKLIQKEDLVLTAQDFIVGQLQGPLELLL